VNTQIVVFSVVTPCSL